MIPADLSFRAPDYRFRNDPLRLAFGFEAAKPTPDEALELRPDFV